MTKEKQIELNKAWRKVKKRRAVPKVSLARTRKEKAKYVMMMKKANRTAEELQREEIESIKRIKAIKGQK